MSVRTKNIWLSRRGIVRGIGRQMSPCPGGPAMSLDLGGDGWFYVLA